MEKGSKIFVAGHRGLVGSAVVRNLEENGYTNIITKTRDELDLTDYEAVLEFFYVYKPHYVILAAAKVGGIVANRDYPADFISDNLRIQNNIIQNCSDFGVKKLCFLGSSCIYPKMCDQPMKEEYLLTGPLESTNESYAIAKIAGIKMCQAYKKQYGLDSICLMPTNLYGIGDNFDLETSHVLPALIRKILEAKNNGDKEFTIWGTGTPKREFLYSEDLADAIIFLMNNYSGDDVINIGTGRDISIIDVAKEIADIIGFEGDICTDTSKPDGTPRKLLDVSKINSIGWEAKTNLREGLKKTIDWFTG